MLKTGIVLQLTGASICEDEILSIYTSDDYGKNPTTVWNVHVSSLKVFTNLFKDYSVEHVDDDHYNIRLKHKIGDVTIFVLATGRDYARAMSCQKSSV
jgi:hypothetical protein